MLRELRVAGLAVVADARLEPGPGFTALTGETGAGKSVCVTALRAALGGRLDADSVRPGAPAARVAAVFDDVPPACHQLLEALSLPEDDLLTLTREAVAAGRGACRVNGALVSQSVLRSIGDTVADVTIQGASQRLLQPAWQRAILDASSPSLPPAAAAVAEAVSTWREALASLETVRASASSSERSAEAARAIVADLEPLQLRRGEQESLHAEHLRLVQSARLVAGAGALAAAAGADETGAADRLAAAGTEVRRLTSIDPALTALAAEAELLTARLRDLSLDARRYADGISPDEARRREVEARLDAMDRVCRRHGSVEAALDELENARRVLDGQGWGADVCSAEAAAASAATAAADAAGRLSRERAVAARRLEQAVTGELRTLGMAHARFRVVLGRRPDPQGLDLGDGAPVHCGRSGADQVEFRLTANRDMVPAPLDQVASGGELSRLALAVAAVVTEDASPLLVLDEIDTGIGGETAARVGETLARIGARRQVLAVTHRPEIAARAQDHLVVTKTADRGMPVAVVDSVGAERRVAEVARLMSGRQTTAALARARELIAEGGTWAGARPAPGRTARTM